MMGKIDWQKAHPSGKSIIRWVPIIVAGVILLGLGGMVDRADLSDVKPPKTMTPMMRPYVHVVGSSSVYPFTAMLAERFGRMIAYRTPVLEITGTGAGIHLFCSGVGSNTPDMVNASRPMKVKERAYCAQHGVTHIEEIALGRDGIILAFAPMAPMEKHSGVMQHQDVAMEAIAFDNLAREELFYAMAAYVPDITTGKLVPNPYHRWRDVADHLPDLPIHCYVPPSTSGTYESFMQLAILPVCMEHRAVVHAYPNRAQREDYCRQLRHDGAVVDAGENDDVIIQKLLHRPGVVGMITYRYWMRHAHQIRALKIDRSPPSFETLQAGMYPLMRDLFIYVKHDNQAFAQGLEAFASLLRDPKERQLLLLEGLIPAANLHYDDAYSSPTITIGE